MTPPTVVAGADADAAARRFLDQVGEYLTATGWRPLVAGPIQIERLDGFRWRLVVDFTGAEPRRTP